MGAERERRRPGYAPGGRRDAILDAALDEFAAGGYNGTSLAKVAERAGLTQQGLLHYFPSKQALLVALLNHRDEVDAAAADRDADRGTDADRSRSRNRGRDSDRDGGQVGDADRDGERAGDEHREGGGPGRVDLEEIVRRNVERRGIVQVYTVLSAESVTEGHPAQQYFRDRFDGLRKSIGKRLREEHGGRLPSGVAPEDAAALLIAAMDGLQTQWLHDPRAVDMPRLVSTLTDVLTSPARGGKARDAED